MSKKPNIYIIDDHEMFREGVKMMLSKANEFNVIGEACDGEQGIKELPPETDIILMDISMPKMDGIQTTQKLMQSNDNLKIIALSMYGDEVYYYKMIHAGAKGFVLKDTSSHELIHAINEVDKGEYYFSQELLRNIILNIGDKEINPLLSKEDTIEFTSREKEVIAEIASGLSNKEIADKLNLGLRTIESYKSQLIKKTGVRNTIGLVVYAIKNRIISIG